MNDFKNIRKTDSPAVDTEHLRLAERPTRKSHRPITALVFLLCGCLIILGGGGVLVWQWISHTSVPSSTVSSSTPTNGSSSGKLAAGCTGAREPVDVIMQQTAQGLHLTVAQVQARVLNSKTITQIATEQGLTETQLHEVEVQALQFANNQWLRMNCITRQDVQNNIQRDTGSPTYMDEEFTNWFKG